MGRIHRSLPEKGTRVGIAYSGGLDTRTAVAWLSRQGLVVHAYTADLAQPDETDVASNPQGRPRARRHGRARSRLPRGDGHRGHDCAPMRRVPRHDGR